MLPAGRWRVTKDMEEIGMNIRKVLAGSMAAIAAGATIAFGAFAQSTSLGDYVGGTSTAPVPPWVVIGVNTGDPQFAKDVLGAADLAAGTAGYVTVSKAVGGAAEVSVSGGVSLSTANTKILGGDAINTAKDTLTSEDLPTILASGTFEDDDGTAYEYDQYIVVGASTVGLSLSNSDDVLGDDPAPLIDIGTVPGSPAYTMKVIFNKDLNFSNSVVDGNAIELFGTEYTISSDSDSNTLVLYGGANKQTLSEGETATVDVGGVSYEVSLIGVSDTNTIVIKVNDVSRTIDEGNSRKVSGLEVYVDEVYFLQKEAQVSSARLSFGSSRLTLDSGDEVSVGSGADAEDIDNTAVTITPGTDGASVLEIAVAAPNSDGDFAAVDMPFTDPVFGTFKLAFGGGTPALADMELFEFDTSGDDTAILKMTDSKGNSKTVEWAFDSATGTQGGKSSLELGDGDENDVIVVLEGGNATEDDYIVINQDDFSHLLEVTEIDTDTGDSDPTLTLKDAFSGTNYEVQMTETSASSGVFNGTKIIDGKTYRFWSNSNPDPDVMAVVWGDATAVTPEAGVNTGAVTSVFPTLVAAKGAEIAFLDNLSSTEGITTTETGKFEILGIEVTLSNATAGTLLTGTGITYYYENATTGYLTIETVSGPAVGILEEEGKDTSGDDVQNIVIVEADDDSDGEIIIDTSGSPLFSDGVQVAAGWLSTSDNDVDVTGDRYGVFASRNTDSQGSADVYYPDTQVIMAVGIGANPVFSVSGEAGTVQEAYQITAAVAKLASEVNTATLSRDVILVGGPCANTLVATLMEVATTYPECAAPFDGLSEGMVKEYTDAFGSGQKALVVAGVVADDTRALAGKVVSGAISSYDYEA
jgi:hypothetical protein